jgi:hypothetical protein
MVMGHLASTPQADAAGRSTRTVHGAETCFTTSKSVLRRVHGE